MSFRLRIEKPIKAWEGGSNFWLYCICFQTSNTAFRLQKSKTCRRFSEFEWLRKELDQLDNWRSPPRLPGKRLWLVPVGNGCDQHHLEKRRSQLQQWLIQVLQDGLYLSSLALHLFLQTELSVGQIQQYLQGGLPEEVLEQVWSNQGKLYNYQAHNLLHNDFTHDPVEIKFHPEEDCIPQASLSKTNSTGNQISTSSSSNNHTPASNSYDHHISASNSSENHNPPNSSSDNQISISSSNNLTPASNSSNNEMFTSNSSENAIPSSNSSSNNQTLASNPPLPEIPINDSPLPQTPTPNSPQPQNPNPTWHLSQTPNPNNPVPQIVVWDQDESSTDGREATEDLREGCLSLMDWAGVVNSFPKGRESLVNSFPKGRGGSPDSGVQDMGVAASTISLASTSTKSHPSDDCTRKENDVNSRPAFSINGD